MFFTDDTHIKELNTQYRNKKKATDVLSFSHFEGIAISPWDTSIGELVISVETLCRQAKKFKVTVEEELIRLLVHGTLHLLGFDHEKVGASVAAKMRREEKRLRGLVLEANNLS